MAELVMRVRAEYESAQRCREEIRKVNEALKAVNENTSPQEIEKLTKRYVELTESWDKSISFLGKVGVFVKDALSGVGRAAKESASGMQEMEGTARTVLEAAQRRLQVEENVLDVMKKQRDELAKNGDSKLSTKDLEAKIQVYDQLIENLSERKDNLSKTVEDLQLVMPDNIDAVEAKLKDLTQQVVDTGNKVIDMREKMKSTDGKDVNEMLNDAKNYGDAAKAAADAATQAIELQERYVEQLSNKYDELQARLKDPLPTDNVGELGAEAAETSVKLQAAVVQLDNLKQVADGAKVELGKAEDIQKVGSAIDGLEGKLQSIKGLFGEIKFNTDEANEAFASYVNRSTSLSDQFKSTLNSVAAIAGVAFGIHEVKNFIGQVASTREYFQDIESSMKTFLGSAEKAADFTKQLKDYAWYNMFEFSDLAKASQQMIAYGHDVDPIIPKLDMLSNIAAGTHAPLMEMIDAYNRAKSTGMVDAQNVKSWATKGVVIRDVLRDMGETAVGTSVTFEQLNKVLEHLTSEGGMFHNLMKEQLNNISAEKGQLEDNLASMFNEIGEKLQGAITKWYKLQSDMVDNYTDIAGGEGVIDFVVNVSETGMDFLMENWKELMGYIKDAIALYGMWRVALLAVTPIMKIHNMMQKAETTARLINNGSLKMEGIARGEATKSIVLQTQAQKALNASMLASPWAWAAIAVTGLAFALYKYYTSIVSATDAQDALNAAEEKHNDLIDNSLSKADEDIRVIKDKTSSIVAQTRAYKDLIKEVGAFSKYTPEEIANMSSDEIDRIKNQYKQQQQDDFLVNEVKALEEFYERYKLEGSAKSAWMYKEGEFLKELEEKYKLGEGWAESFDEKIGGFSNVTNAAFQFMNEAKARLQKDLEETSETAIINGLRNGFSDSKARTDAGNVLSSMFIDYEKINSQERELEKLEEEIERVNSKLRKTGSQDKEYGELIKTLKNLKERYDELSESVPKAKDALNKSFGGQINEKIKEANAQVEEFNRQLKYATGDKKTEIEVKRKEAQDNLDFWEGLKKLIEAGKVNTEVIIDIKRNVENAEMDDTFLADLGDDYSKIDDLFTDFANRLSRARSQFKELSEEGGMSAEEIAEMFGVTAEDIEQEFDNAKKGVEGDLDELKEKIKDVDKDTEEHRKLELEIAKKEEQLVYLERLRSELLALAANPFSIMVDISAKMSGGLSKILGFFGVDVSSLAQRAGNEAKGRMGGESKPDTHSAKYYSDLEAKKLKEKQQQYKTFKSGKGTITVNGTDYDVSNLKADEYDKLKNYFKDVSKGSKGGNKGAKEELQRRQKEYDLFIKNREKQQELAQQSENAAEEARIAGIQNAGLRERAERQNQFRLRQQQIDDQIEAFKKQNVEAEKEEWSNKKENKGKIWADTETAQNVKKYGYDNISLTADQSAIIKSQQEKLNAEIGRNQDEQLKRQNKATVDLLKAWGDYEQQKLAITQEYEEKIKDAMSPQERAGYVMQRDKELEKLNNDKLFENIDWDGVFSDLQGHSEKYLIGLRDQLQELLKNGQVTDVTQMATLQEKIYDINEEISKQGGLFDFVGERQREHNRLVEEAIAAEERRKTALEEQLRIEQELQDTESSIRSAFKDMGLDEDIDIDLGEGGTEDYIRETYGEQSEEYKKLKPLLDSMATGELKLADARKKTAQATKDAEKAEDKKDRKPAQAVADWFSDAQEFIQKKGIDQIPELMNTIGLEDIGNRVQKGLDGFNDAAGAAKDFASGNYIGAALKGISAVNNVGEALGLWSNSNVEESEKEIDRLIKSNAELGKALDDLRNEMKDINLSDLSAYTKAQEVAGAQIANGLKVVQTKMGEYEGHHSTNYYSDYATSILKSIAESAMRQGVIDNRKLSNPNQGINTLLTYLTPDELDKLRTFDPKEWIKFMNALRDADKADLGAADTLLEYVDTYSDLLEDLENEWKETMLNLSWDSLKDSFRSALEDMEKDVESWNDDLDDIFRKGVSNYLSTTYTNKDTGLLAKWYEKYFKAMEIGGLDANEVAQLREEYLAIVQEATAERDRLYETLGIVESTNQEQQSATFNSAQNITYEQADAIVGIETAQLIVMEQSKTELNLLNVKADQFSLTQTEQRDIAADSRDILAGMAIHVEEIRDGVVDTIVPRIKNIDNNLNKVYKLVEAQ